MKLMKNLLKNRKKNTIFTLSEIAFLSNILEKDKLYSYLKYAVQNRYLTRISRGIYALDDSYDRQEFANKYRSPSYISLYTVLQEKGVVFQPYSSIYAVSQRSETVEIHHQEYCYRKIQDIYLLNPLGILNQNGVNKASLERALCDTVYLDGAGHFDNLRSVDWKMIKKIYKEVYQNHPAIKELIRKVRH
jgi:hypothetical protein